MTNNKEYETQKGTVREYLDCLKKWSSQLEERDSQLSVSKTYYRGQSDKNYDLSPSVFRTGYTYEKEQNMVGVACAIAHSYLVDCKTSLEVLVKLQHAGLPTRLLDITHNSLVALYFAVRDARDREKDGCVYCGRSEYVSYNMWSEIIADFVVKHKEPSYKEKDLKKLYPSMFSENDCRVVRNSILDALCKPYYILPPYNNERIKAQSGAFIIAPLISKVYRDGLKSDDILIMDHEVDLESEQYGMFSEYRYVVRKEHKSKLLNELEEMGISEDKLFPDSVDRLMERIKKEFSDKYRIG